MRKFVNYKNAVLGRQIQRDSEQQRPFLPFDQFSPKIIATKFLTRRTKLQIEYHLRAAPLSSHHVQ